MYLTIHLKSKIIFLIIFLLIATIIFLLIHNSQSFIPSQTRKMEFRVAVDAGHGGIDTGTSYGKLYEKDINLQIAKFLAEELAKSNIIPIMTRQEDQLYQNSRREDIKYRPRLANEKKADLFISIHTNSFPSSQPAGSQIFHKPGSVASQQLAESIQEELVKLRPENNRTIKEGDFYVLKQLNCPGILLEVGFISNPEDRKLLADSEYQLALAQAIKKGVINYLQASFDQVEGEEKIARESIGSQTYIYEENSVYYLSPAYTDGYLIKKRLSLPTNFDGYQDKSLQEILVISSLKQLLSPPEGLISPLPPGTKVQSVQVTGGRAKIDFSREFSTNFIGGATFESSTVEAILKTLFSLPGIQEVEILVDGQSNATMGGHIFFNQIFFK